MGKVSLEKLYLKYKVLTYLFGAYIVECSRNCHNNVRLQVSFFPIFLRQCIRKAAMCSLL